MQLNDQQIERREARKKLLELNIDPYPAELFEVNVSTADIIKNYEKQNPDNAKNHDKQMLAPPLGGALFVFSFL